MSNAIKIIDDNSYTYHNQSYYINFPLEWVMNHFPGSGPKQCQSCYLHGVKNGVFIGYCSDCATYIYDCQRGHGFQYGVEYIDIENKETSANYTYLKYSQYMNIVNIFSNNRKRVRSDSFSLKSISSEKEEYLDKIIVTPRRCDSSISLCDLLLNTTCNSSE